MNWIRKYRYRALGRVVNSREGLILVFDLDEAVMYVGEETEEISEKTGKPKVKQVAYYPDKYKETHGQVFTDFLEARQMNLFEYLEDYETKTYSDMQKEAGSEVAAELNTYNNIEETDSAEASNDSNYPNGNGGTQIVASTQHSTQIGITPSGMSAPNGYTRSFLC